MAITRGFFNSINGDRKYNAEDIGNYFEGLITNGIYQTVGDRFVCLAGGTGLTVNVGTGKAMINSHWIKSDSIILLTISPADVQYTRYDAIVICLDKSEGIRSIDIYVKKGTPTVNPSVPELIRTEYVHELLIATVKVTANATIIKQSDITDMRLDTNSCGFVTGLVDQVDTSDLFLQYSAMFNEYYKIWTANFESWFRTLTSELKVNTSLSKNEATVIMGSASKSVFTGKIEYNEGDILLVYVDGIMFIEGVDYTITDITPLTLNFNTTLSSGTTVYFLCIKSVIGNSGSGSGGGSNGNESATPCTHNYKPETVAPTCTEDGYIKYTCLLCGDTYKDAYVDATGHESGAFDFRTENVVNPTCTEPGSYTKIKICNKCGADLSRSTVTLEATGHTDENNDGLCDTCGASTGGLTTKQITFDTSDGTIEISCNGVHLNTITHNIYTHTFNMGDAITLKYTPDSGLGFKFWMDNDKFEADSSDYDYSYDNPLTFTVNESCPANIGVMIQY